MYGDDGYTGRVDTFNATTRMKSYGVECGVPKQTGVEVVLFGKWKMVLQYGDGSPNKTGCCFVIVKRSIVVIIVIGIIVVKGVLRESWRN